VSALSLQSIDAAVSGANVWINEVNRRAGWDNKQRSYRLLRQVLHVLRDHLCVGEAAQLGAQLPTMIRGICYEGCTPSKNPEIESAAEGFIARIQDAFEPDPLGNPEDAIAAVVDVLDAHSSEGEWMTSKARFQRRSGYYLEFPPKHTH